MVSNKHNKGCEIFNCTEHLLMSTPVVTVCVSFFVFVSLVGILVGIASSAATVKICAITAVIKKYKSIIKKKKV